MNQMDSDFNQQNILNFAHQSNSPVSDEYSSSRSNSIVNDNSGSATPFYTVINVAKQLVCSLFWFGMDHRHCLYLDSLRSRTFFIGSVPSWRRVKYFRRNLIRTKGENRRIWVATVRGRVERGVARAKFGGEGGQKVGVEFIPID